MTPTLSASFIKEFPVSTVLGLCILVTSVVSLFKRKYLLMLLLHPVSIIRDNQYYRLLTSDLVHNDFTHLLINEVLLITYCSNLEVYLNRTGKFGSEKFFLIYLTSCITGSLITTIRHSRDFSYSSAGASGSIMGCLFSFSILQPHLTAFFLPGIGPVPNLYFGLICIAGLVIYQLKSKNALLNHEVHFFGAIGGIVSTLLLFPGIIK